MYFIHNLCKIILRIDEIVYTWLVTNIVKIDQTDFEKVKNVEFVEFGFVWACYSFQMSVLVDTLSHDLICGFKFTRHLNVRWLNFVYGISVISYGKMTDLS